MYVHIWAGNSVPGPSKELGWVHDHTLYARSLGSRPVCWVFLFNFDVVSYAICVYLLS